MTDYGYIGDDSFKRIVEQTRAAEVTPKGQPEGPRLVRPSEGVSYLATLNGALSYGGSVLATIWSGQPLAATGVTVKAYDWYLKTGQTLASATKVEVRWYSGRLYVVGAACSP